MWLYQKCGCLFIQGQNSSLIVHVLTHNKPEITPQVLRKEQWAASADWEYLTSSKEDTRIPHNEITWSNLSLGDWLL